VSKLPSERDLSSSSSSGQIARIREYISFESHSLVRIDGILAQESVVESSSTSRDGRIYSQLHSNVVLLNSTKVDSVTEER
jgi:hypothetical protein